jgi:hypothetical protein
MAGEEVRQGCEASWPQEAIDRLCQACGGVPRERTRNLRLVVRALVISAGPPSGA